MSMFIGAMVAMVFTVEGYPGTGLLAFALGCFFQ